MQYDLISFGRVAVDLYADEINCPLEKVETFKRYLGGCAGNIAVGTSRLGLKTKMLSKVGNDAMGKFILDFLSQEQVNTDLIQITEQHLTGLVLLGINPPDNFPLIFYRENCADMSFTEDDIKKDILDDAKSLLFTGTGLSTDVMAKVTKKLLDIAKNLNKQIIFDLDYRPVLWKLVAKGNGEDRYVAAEYVSVIYQQFLSYCNLIVGTEEEIKIAGGSDCLTTAVSNIEKFAPNSLLVCKLGENGAIAYDFANDTQYNHKGFKTKVLNVLGAGDGFMSGFLRGYLRNFDIDRCLELANAAGSIVVGKHGCAPAMPNYTQLQELIGVTNDSVVY